MSAIGNDCFIDIHSLLLGKSCSVNTFSCLLDEIQSLTLRNIYSLKFYGVKWLEETFNTLRIEVYLKNKDYL